jgi:anaerobic magnesium-protoporphyrin IX monomethyl ester cyclase
MDYLSLQYLTTEGGISMRIAFVYPALQFDNEHHFEALPIGLLYLTSVIEKEYGTIVDIFDSRHGPALPDPSKINEYDVIGFTAMSMQINHALRMAQGLKKTGYRGKFVFGGPHASVATDHLKKESFIDAILVGEAEDTFLQYLHYLEGKSHQLQRVWIRNGNGEWSGYYGENYIKNLDTLPFPAREKYGELIKSLRMINMTTTRGCPYQCNYCQPTKRILFGKSIRRRSVDSIMAEIEDAVDRFNINHFSIDDDTFTFNKTVVLDFCERVKALGFKWSCQSRSDIDRETLEEMHNAGCNMIYVGVESGSQRVLNLMNKKNTVEKNAEFINNCNEIGIKAWCNMMVGYPGETRDDMEKSLEFVKETKPPRVCVSQVTPFPGTDLWTTNKEDLIERSWDDIARHIQKPKFKSLAANQRLISYYTIIMTKNFGQPLNSDVIESSKFLSSMKWILPFLARFPNIVRILRKIRLKMG